MTKEEARIILLEDALMQAQWTIQFLHGCLTHPSNGEMNGGYEYAYPEQTVAKLEEMEKLVPLPPMCCHAHESVGLKDSCKSCLYWTERKPLIYLARMITNGKKEGETNNG